ncbi:hypothetical protein [Staphylococcus sp. LKG3-3]|uniref:hypothetical protein n=1 Tax=Staphylococcus sp. LKG3-3 TaxID=3399685 RepID=UPI003D59D2F8
MEIRLCDITNNKADIRDCFIVDDGKILIDGNRLYDVILDTDKVTLHQQMEMFDSKEEMFKKAKVFNEIEQAYWKSNTPENFAYEVVGIFEEHFNDDKVRVDDEE